MSQLLSTTSYKTMNGIIGIFFLLGIAYVISEDRKNIKFRLIIWGLSLQLAFAILILKTPVGRPVFGFLDKSISKLISFSNEGSSFLFQSFIPGVGYHDAMINFAFRALPTVIFFSGLMAVLHHFKITQFITKWIANVMQKTMKTSGPETLSVASNIFVGQTEAPLVIRPYISKMTNSELMVVMVGGFATVAGGVLAMYVTWLSDIPGIAGHLLAASVMSAPAALVIAKIIYPENEEYKITFDTKIYSSQNNINAMEALGNGATDGLKLAGNIAAMLIAFISIIGMVDYLFSLVNTSIDQILGVLFRPLAWTMGIPWDESKIFGMLMGKKIAFTELIAYNDLKELILSKQISEKTAIIASYALCGFANFGSIGIQLGGIGGIAPERKKDLSKLALKAMIGGALASWLTATIAGVLL